MMLRMRSVAASGARVKPAWRPVRSSSSRSIESGFDPQGRQRDGQMLAGKALGDGFDQIHNMRIVRRGKGEQRHFFKPVLRAILRCACTISSTGRSRTGRVIMPAWQKRQPRVQPRIISIGNAVVNHINVGDDEAGGRGRQLPTRRFSTFLGASSYQALDRGDGAIGLVAALS